MKGIIKSTEILSNGIGCSLYVRIQPAFVLFLPVTPKLVGISKKKQTHWVT